MSDDQNSLERGRGCSKERQALIINVFPKKSSGGEGVREGDLIRSLQSVKTDKSDVKRQKLTE